MTINGIKVKRVKAINGCTGCIFRTNVVDGIGVCSAQGDEKVCVGDIFIEKEKKTDKTRLEKILAKSIIETTKNSIELADVKIMFNDDGKYLSVVVYN